MSRDYVLQPFSGTAGLQIDYARELNPQQLAAVTALPGPALVLAGAGAGKTRTLIYRVAYLLEQGVPPRSLLLLTFTNKAAREMMRRVAELLANDLTALWGGTFHAVGNRVLRRHAELLGYPHDFTILDREDSLDLLKACREEVKKDETAPMFPKADVLAEIYSLAANTRQSVPELLARRFSFLLRLGAPILEVERSYTARKRAAGVMDFDDLLVLWLRLLEEHPEVLEQYQRRFQFLLVDEYQDTNRLQSELIDLLAARHHNLMVVGDDSQSIYSWRGANFQNILEFQARHPQTQVYKIETNYRSTPEILAVANAAISPNVRQFPKQLVPARKPGPKPALVVCGDARVQAAFVAQRALQLCEEGVNLGEMAVLYRSHFHALELQMELTRRQIPFAITSGIRFFEQAHIKDVAAYLRLACNPRDELAFKRLVKMLPGVGPKAATKLWARFGAEWEARSARLHGPQPRPAMAHSGLAPAGPPGPALEDRPPPPASPPLSPSVLSAAFDAVAASVPRKAAAAWAQLRETLAQVQDESMQGDPGEQIQLVLEAGYEDYILDSYANSRARLDDLEQLGIFAAQFSSLEEFLSQLALLTNLEAEGDHLTQRDPDRLRLTTVHQAKGLEFTVVFVIMLCEGMFPSQRSTENPEAVEEERRLFYVAITRAKTELHLSYPLIRATRTQGAGLKQQPSRFLRELPRELVEPWNLVPAWQAPPE